VDLYHPSRAIGAPHAMAPWNDSGVLSAADIHMASTLVRLGGGPDPLVALGVAFVVRALRMGHVCVELAALPLTVSADEATVPDGTMDVRTLPWPDPGDWTSHLHDSPLVALGDDDQRDRPLRLVGSRLYLDRYWFQERQVAHELLARWDIEVDAIDHRLLDDGLRRLFPQPATPGSGDAPRHPLVTASAPAGYDHHDPQVVAASAALRLRFAVVAGGPGTGKTTTIARIVALLIEQSMAAGGRPARIALAAPTGRAAARLEEAVQSEAAAMDVEGAVRDQMRSMGASTLHRILGWRPDSHSRFRYDAGNRLPHDTVIVDETSMVSLSLMAKLLGALRPTSRLILVGDPQQLASVEAGAVLGDIVGPAISASATPVPGPHGAARPASSDRSGGADRPGGLGGRRGDGGGIVVLRRVHRFGGEIAGLADAIAAGDGDGVVEQLRAAPVADETWPLRWIELTAPSPTDDVALGPVRRSLITGARALGDAASAGHAVEALALVGASRVLCAHRQGPYGVESWTDRVEGWLRHAIPGYGEGDLWYPGRPILVTRNDYELQLYNGDTGVVVLREDGSTTVVFERRGGLVEVSPSRLETIETLHASTVHKAQGSQFNAVTVVLPEPTSPILTRELLYTAVTRARQRVIVVGEETSLRAAVDRPIGRASGLGQRLWA
jgi:exodeoxyribonuclease V alpha subunit